MPSTPDIPTENLDFARVDHDRAARCGFPEVVYAAGKSTDQTVTILRALRQRHPVALATRVPDAMFPALHEAFGEQGRAWPDAHLYMAGALPDPVDRERGVLVVSAGTSDRPVAREALWTARVMGVWAESLDDVGVAGLHRLLEQTGRLRRARVIVAVAGMEGALASVVTGLVSSPVIACPTSVGYGASFQGLAALMAMLNSCATGLAVVNIDNGFGAGALAARIILAGREPADTTD